MSFLTNGFNYFIFFCIFIIYKDLFFVFVFLISS